VTDSDKASVLHNEPGSSPAPSVEGLIARLWRRIRWYPWRSRDEWIHSQEGKWWPWPEPRLDSYGKPNPKYDPQPKRTVGT
jgi:hypothetical protein